MIFGPSITQYFKQFPWMKQPELIKYCPMILLPSITQLFKLFSRVELYTELMKCSPMILVPSITQ